LQMFAVSFCLNLKNLCCLLVLLNRSKCGRTWKVSYFGNQSSENSSKGYSICCECFWFHHGAYLCLYMSIWMSFYILRLESAGYSKQRSQKMYFS
jgi:hypothetical protein